MRAYKTLTEHFSESWSKVTLTALNIPYLRWDVPYVLFVSTCCACVLSYSPLTGQGGGTLMYFKVDQN